MGDVIGLAPIGVVVVAVSEAEDVHARATGGLDARPGVLDRGAPGGLDTQPLGYTLVDVGFWLGWLVDGVGADHRVDAETEALPDDVDPVVRRRRDQANANAGGLHRFDEFLCAWQYRHLLAVDPLGCSFVPVEKRLAIHREIVVLVEVVVQFPVVHAGRLRDGDVTVAELLQQFRLFGGDPEILGIDEHAVHIEEKRVHTPTSGRRWEGLVPPELAGPAHTCQTETDVAWIAGALPGQGPGGSMDATLSAGVVRAGNEARERFYDSRGYGQPVDGGAIELAPVEAAHLLYRGDLDAVDGMDFRAFLSSTAVSEVAFFVYKDLRDRGFYLAPADRTGAGAPDTDFTVFPRGKGPWDDAIAYHVRAVGEREAVPAETLGDTVLAIVDEESEITYLDTDLPEVTGSSTCDVPPVDGTLLEDRVICWDPPSPLYEAAFYGQQLDDAVQLSLVEAAYLARAGILSIETETAKDEADAETLIERGQAVEGDRFDRRLHVYATLRDSGIVPKTGFKFGADFRTYAHVESVDDLGHSERLVRVLPTDHVFEPRDLSLDVRLAHGVRKTMVFALVGDGDVAWVSAERLTP